MSANHLLFGAGIAGTGHYAPGRVVTNQQLIDLGLDTSDEWISTKIGVRERRYLGEQEATSDLAAHAARRAMADAGLTPDDVDLLVVATVTPDWPLTSTAQMVQHQLGLRHALSFDVNAACAGFVFALEVAGKYVKDGTCRAALVIGVDSFSTILNYRDRGTCVFFGDGAGAMALRRVPVEDDQLLSGWLQSNGAQGAAVTVPAGGSAQPITPAAYEANRHTFHMNGKAVFQFAVSAAPEAVRRALARIGRVPADLDFIITHQANLNIVKEIVARLGMTMDQTYTNIHAFGNTSGASPIIALDEARRRNLLPDGALVAVTAFGAGLAWGSSILRWRAAA